MNPVPSDIRDRIIASADKIFEDSNFELMPKVDQVRRAAKADMNSTSIVMKEWRKMQNKSAKPAPVVIVPSEISSMFNEGLGAVWSAAQDLTNESLLAAKMDWEAEKKEFEESIAELSSAYDLQTAKLEAIEHQYSVEQDLFKKASDNFEATKNQLADTKHELDQSYAQHAIEINNVARLEQEKISLISENASLKAKSETLEQYTNKMNADLEKSRQKIEVLEEKFQNSTEKWQEELAARIEAEKKLLSVNKDLEHAQLRVEEFKSGLANRDVQHSKIIEKLKQAHSDEMKHLIDRLSQKTKEN